MTISERIKFLRKEKLNMTLEKFGDKLGVTKTTISRIETGERNVTPQMCRAICREFNVSEEWLRTGSGDPFNALDEEEMLFAAVGRLMADKPDSFRRRVVRMIASLTPEEWAAIEKKMREVFSDEKKE